MTRRKPVVEPGLSGRLFIALALFFAGLMLFGGGGAPAPMVHSALSAIALLGLLLLAWIHFFAQKFGAEIRWPSLFVLLILLLPVLQLIPLPYDVWRNLPGRELPARALELVGATTEARPLSLDPESTRFAALAMLPGIFVFLTTALLNERQRAIFAKIAIGVALVSAIVGALQYAAPGTRSLYLFPRAIFTQASGIFANRNFQSDLMLIAILLSAYIVRTQRGQFTVPLGKGQDVNLVICLIPLFAVQTLATVSRTGALMLLPVLLLAYALASRAFWSRTSLAIGAVAFGALGLLFIGSGLVTGVAERIFAFDINSDVRTGVLPDILHAINAYFPFGSGLGTFDPVYRGAESLTVVRETYLNHAHNDYLEILLETGIAGIALVAIFIVAFAIRSWRVLRKSANLTQLTQRRAAALGIGIILLHSVGDYPLRTITLLSVFAFLCGIIFTDGPPSDVPERNRASRSRRHSQRDMPADAFSPALAAREDA